MLTVLSVILGALLLLIIWEYGDMVVYMIKTLTRRLERRFVHNELPKALHPDLREPWKKILNQLDPVSFTRMGRSCTQMYELCVSGAKGLGTKMDGRERNFEIRVTRTDTGIDFHCSIGNGRVVAPAILRKWSIEVSRPTLLILSNKNYPLNCATLQHVAKFLRLIGVKRLGYFGFLEVDHCWDEIKIFSKEFVGEEVASNSLNVLTKGQLIETLKNSTSFLYRYRIPDALLLRARCRRLFSMATKITPGNFRKIIEKWSSNELNIGNWFLSYSFHELFNYIRVLESFIPPACRFDCDHVGVLPFKRPLLFSFGATTCWILRRDGALLNCHFALNYEPALISFTGGKEFENEFCEFSFPRALDKSLYFRKQ